MTGPISSSSSHSATGLNCHGQTHSSALIWQITDDSNVKLAACEHNAIKFTAYTVQQCFDSRLAIRARLNLLWHAVHNKPKKSSAFSLSP